VLLSSGFSKKVKNIYAHDFSSRTKLTKNTLHQQKIVVQLLKIVVLYLKGEKHERF